MKKLILGLILLTALETQAQSVTNSTTNFLVTYQRETNYVRSVFDPSQFNTNLPTYRMTNSPYFLSLSNLQYNSLATGTSPITSTGITNTTAYMLDIWYDATNSTITNFDSAGSPIRTNIGMSGSGLYMELQAGGKMTASGGLQGTAHPK